MVAQMPSAWYLDDAWRFRATEDGGGILSVPHPSRAGLTIDTSRSLDLRSATRHYAVFAYRDEEVQPYRHGEYRVPKRVFVLCRLELTPLPVALELVLDDEEWACEQLVVARPP